MKKEKLNPTPISKFIAVIIVSFTVMHPVHSLASFGVALFISLFFLLQGLIADAVKGMLWFFIFLNVPTVVRLGEFNEFFQLFIIFFIAFKMFFLSFLAGKFFIKTSDCSSIIASMHSLHIPDSISIPIAVMFRFFPSYKEERKNIKYAMRLRGISLKTPLKYLEYVTIPILVISSNIADDISKAAEVKAVANPIKKELFIKNTVKFIDFVYVLVIFTLVVGGYYAGR